MTGNGLHQRRLGPAALEKYLRRLREIRETGGAQAETSYYPALELLLNSVGEVLNPKVHAVSQLANVGAGSPDFGFYEKASGALRGVVEAKPTSDDSLKTASGSQVVKYHRQYGLLLVTNYRDFLLVTRDRFGELQVENRYSLADSENAFWSEPARRLAVQHGEMFWEFLAEALTRSASVTKASQLAESLARYAREALIRLRRQDVESLDPLRSAMTQTLGLHFREEKGEDFFRSSLVQTLFYGLFSAWILWRRREGNTQARFDWRTASDYVQLPLVESLFEEIARPSRLRDLNLREPLEWAEDALNRVAPEEFFASFEEEEAIQYFYEPFLEAFDPDLRDSLGVWYTPPEIVQYQVSRIDRLLEQELGIQDGLADRRVIVLDPVAGTGSYLVQVLETIHRRLRDQGKEATAALEVKQAALTRIFGFEILPAPFVVAHLQLGLLLNNLGANLTPGERLSVYLTNALTGWEPPKAAKTQIVLSAFPELIREQEAADHVKREEPILVILGNPPYNAFAGTAEEEEADLIAPYKQGLRDNWGVMRQSLDDLYIRFWRLGERRIAEGNGRGVVSFISNNSWLEGGSHPVMRQHLLSAFDQIWIDNLHGNRLVSERAPNGQTCETIFKRSGHSVGIKVGTAIACLVKKSRAGEENLAKVYYRDVWGRPGAEDSWGRAEEKRRALVESISAANFPTLYQSLPPRKETRWVLVPAKENGDYSRWPSLPEVFPVYFCGVNTNRDEDLVSTDREPLEARMRAYYDPQKTDEQVKAVCPVLMTDASGFDAAKTRKDLLARSSFAVENIVRCAYRPFDERWLYWEPFTHLLNRPRPDLFAQVWEGNQFLVTYVKQHRGATWDELLVSEKLVDYHCFHPNTSPIPLYVRSRNQVGDNDVHAGDKLPRVRAEVYFDESYAISLNAVPALIKALCKRWSVPLEEGGLLSSDAHQVGIDLFHHAVAILQSTAYREENAGELRQNWPRLPIPQDRELLAASAALGRAVADLLQSDTQVPGVTAGLPRRDLETLGKPKRVTKRAYLPGISRKTRLLEALSSEDLKVTVRYSGHGRWEERAFMPGEKPEPHILRLLGERTANLWWNDVGYWSNVPDGVWAFTIGGYPVLKKWLTYRHIENLGRPLKPDELNHVRDMIRRIAAIMLMGPELDANYRAVCGSARPGKGNP